MQPGIFSSVLLAGNAFLFADTPCGELALYGRRRESARAHVPLACDEHVLELLDDARCGYRL